MSTISRLITWSSGDTLTAAALNAEYNNIVNDYNGSVANANISGSAAIAYSKLNLTSGILNADVSASAAIAESKLLFSGTGHGHSGGTDGKSVASTIALYRTSTVSEFTTTSTSMVDVTNYSIASIVLSAASDVEINIMCDYQKNSSSGALNSYQILRDSTAIGSELSVVATGVNENQALLIRRTIKNLTAATYTFKLQGKVGAGTMTFGTGEMTVSVKNTG